MWVPSAPPILPFGLLSVVSVSIFILMVLPLITAGQANKEGGESPHMPISQPHRQGQAMARASPEKGQSLLPSFAGPGPWPPLISP